jgi:uncharacterized lipoprotein
MPAAQKSEKKKDDEDFDVRIRDQVMRVMGEPTGRYAVRVRFLWKNHYRVNVFIGEDETPAAVSGKIAHSHFLVTDSVGEILEATPRLSRKYGTS